MFAAAAQPTLTRQGRPVVFVDPSDIEIRLMPGGPHTIKYGLA